MKFLLLLIIFLNYAGNVYTQKIEKAGLSEITHILNNSENKLFVVNFWATWCGPCVKEIPYFENVSKNYQNEKVEFILMSLDFPSQLETRLIPFVRTNNISLRVIMVDELDYDKWMNLVDKTWQGNLPSTLFFNNTKSQRQFINRPLDEAELMKIINSMMSN